MNRKKTDFYKSLSIVVLPIIIQNLISAAVNSADVFMLGYVGQTELSAVSLANQFQFLLGGFFFGVSSGIVMLCSQYWGKRDKEAIFAVMGIAFRLSLLVTGLFAMGALFFPEAFMRIYTNDEELVYVGVYYLRIIGFSYVLMSFSQVYESTLRSIERAYMGTAISSLALGLNIFLNAVFIFGWFGIEPMGVRGVAIATVMARSIEVILCLMDLLMSRVFTLSGKVFFGHHKLLFMDFLKYSIPAMLNDIIWTLAFSSYSVVLGHLNADIVAANSVVSTVRGLCTTVCFGLANGGAVIIGKEIGEGRMTEAKRDCDRICVLTLISGICMGIVLLAMRPMVFRFFPLNARATSYLKIMLYINSYYITGQAINTTLIAGLFRAGGDSRFGLICDTISMWVVCVPLAFISAFVLKLPPMWVYFILCLDEFWKMPVVIRYYKSYKWLKNITREDALS